jgi:AcrR family transcriptional regulator
MGRRRQVSDLEISAAAREVFLDRGPKAPVAMVAKKLGVSTAALFQRTGSKQQLMLMALQPAGSITALERGLQPDVPARLQLHHVLAELNDYLGSVISASITLRAAQIESELPEPTPYRLRELLAQWLTQATASGLLQVTDAATTADVMIGALESRHIHAYMRQEPLSSKRHHQYIDAMLDVVLPGR